MNGRQAAQAKEAAAADLLQTLLAGYRLESVDDARSQVLGVDYLLYDGPWRSTLEVKADYRAHETGNAFIELTCDTTCNWPGWAYTATAQYLAYLVVATPELLLLPVSQLRARLPRWQRRYRTAYAADDDKGSEGLLVPLSELRRLSLWQPGRRLFGAA